MTVSKSGKKAVSSEAEVVSDDLTFSVSQILGNERSDFQVEELLFYEDFPSDDGVLLRLKSEITSLGFRLSGDVTGTVSFLCDRCLQPVNEVIDLALDEEFVVTKKVDELLDSVLEEFGELEAEKSRRQAASKKEVRLESFYEEVSLDGTIDIDDMVRQWLVMETTGQHRCGRDDCEETFLKLAEINSSADSGLSYVFNS